MTFALYSFGAFFMAILAIVILILAIGFASRCSEYLFQLLMLLIVAASTGTILLTDRVLTYSEQGLSIVSETSLDSNGGLLGKLLLVMVIGFAFAMCASWVLTRKKIDNIKNKISSPQSKSDFVIAFMIFYTAFSILPIAFGEKFYFHAALIYPFFVFLALFLWEPVSKISSVNIAKQCLGIIVMGSLGAAIFMPELALQPGYSGLIPGFTMRLWGVTANANTLGSVAAVLLVLEVAEPSRRKWMNFLIIVSSVCALILTQSKTSLIAAFIGLLICYSWRIITGLSAGVSIDRKNNSSAAVVLIAGICIVITSVGAWIIFSDISIISIIESKLASRAIGEMSTATGRTEIWQLAIKGGLENPLFGQGANFWGLETRLEYGYTGATHAHNLFLQVFSRSGFIGLTTLLVFIYYLVQYSIRAAKKTRGASFALLSVLLIRSIFEVPIQPNSILGAEFFAMISIFLYVMKNGQKLAMDISNTILPVPYKSHYQTK